MYFRKIVLVTIIASSFLLSGCHGSPESKVDFMIKQIKIDLDLNDSQLSKLEALKKEWFEMQAAQRPEREKEMDQIIANVKSEKLDTSALEKLIKNHEERINVSAPKFLSSIADFHDSLSSHQREKLADRLQSFKNKFSHN